MTARTLIRRIFPPRPLWIALATLLVAVVAGVMHIGRIIFRHERQVGAASQIAAACPETWIYWTSACSPAWLSRLPFLSCPDVFRNVESITFNRGVTDDDLRHLRSFPELAHLNLTCMPVSDAGMIH